MRLVYSLYNLDIQIEENMINILIVENPEIFSVLIQDMISEEKPCLFWYCLRNGLRVL